jgi:hypothetical protein
MSDSSILASLCVAETPGVSAPVTAFDLWQWTWETAQASEDVAGAVKQWATKDWADVGADKRDNYRLQSAVDAFMAFGLRERIYALRVHDGRGLWRVPVKAFVGWAPDADPNFEMTWRSGRLWEWEASEDYRPIVRLELPLRLTEEEADAYRRFVRLELAACGVKRTGQDADPATWAAALMDRPKWNAIEVAAWVCYRNRVRVSEVFGPGSEFDGMLAKPTRSNIETVCLLGEQRDGVHARSVAGTVEQAIQRNGLRAVGCLSEDHARHTLEDVAWHEFYRDDVLEMFPEVGGTQKLESSGETVGRMGDAPAERAFAGWVKSELSNGRLPTPASCYLDLAKGIGRTKLWATDHVRNLPPILRCERGKGPYSVQIGEEHHAAYLDHFPTI